MKLTLYKTLIKPIQVYKGVRVWKNYNLPDNKIIGAAVCCLEIPAKTRVFISMGNSIDNNKCRAEKAIPIWFKVIKPNSYDKIDVTEYGLMLNYCYYASTYHLDIPENISFRSDYDYNFEYKLDKEIKCGTFTTKKHLTCAGGIHFFFRANDAEEYLI